MNELGDGYKSLFYLTLVCSLLELEDKLIEEGENEVEVSRPLLTILAVEEPENHIAPQLLGRVIKELACVAEQSKTQVFLSSHTPAIIKRVSPESIYHFRINENFESVVASIELPEETDEAYKFVKQAVQNYPEIYFAKFVLIGEGDSEEVIIDRFTQTLKLDLDDNIISFAPLGHRFVNHIWKLLSKLNIPYVTLLDLDIEREGGGWGRVKYAIKQLLKVGVKKEQLLRLDNGTILSDEALEEMHNWELKSDDDKKRLMGWVAMLENYNVFYSAPLDVDFLMFNTFSNDYKKIIHSGSGPRIPDKATKANEFTEKVESSVQATLKSKSAVGLTYTDDEKESMIYYQYFFLGRGKPTTHIQALSFISDEALSKSCPEVFTKIFTQIRAILKIEIDVNRPETVATC